jgi:sugar phosphate isomerase/epimerase
VVFPIAVSEVTPMKLGAAVWPFQWQPPYEEAVQRIAALGFGAVELIAWDGEALASYYTPARVRELRSLVADLGLVVSEFVSTPAGMVSPDPGAREACLEHFRRVVEVAAGLGTRTINTVAPMPHGVRVPPLKLLPTAQLWTAEIEPGYDAPAAWERFVEMTGRVVQLVESAGMRYAMEAHPYRHVSSAASMLRLADRVPSPALGMNFDPSHMFPCGDMPQLAIRELGQRVFHCHFSDNDALTNAHWRPGSGKIDWRAVLEALRDVGFDGTISIELEDVPGVATPRQASTPDLDEEYRASHHYLRFVSKELGIQWE